MNMPPQPMTRAKGVMCQELQEFTNTTDARPIHYQKTAVGVQYILTTSHVLHGMHLRYYYGYLSDGRRGMGWSRFNFEGDSDAFMAWLVKAKECKAENSFQETVRARWGWPDNIENCFWPTLLRKPGFVFDSPVVPSFASLAECSNAVDPLRLAPPRRARLNLLDLPREIRDLFYDQLMPDTNVVYPLGWDGLPASTSFITPCGLARTNHQIRSEYYGRLSSNKSEFPALVIGSGEPELDWSALAANYKRGAKICVEFNTLPETMKLRRILRQISDTGVYRTAFFFRSTIDDGAFAEDRTLRFVLFPATHKIPFDTIIQQQLTLSPDLPSGFMFYQATSGPGDSARHCLRANDTLGYVSILSDHTKPTGSEHDLKTLGWDICNYFNISPNEQEALGHALPPIGSDTQGRWLVRGKAVQ